mmetsp:Transcript_25698/g.56355  ORF Transcript_25698/g.56355 Transcript_25698/m.56355 type:complete len:149 (+) Transcript_25698:94-540(+)
MYNVYSAIFSVYSIKARLAKRHIKQDILSNLSNQISPLHREIRKVNKRLRLSKKCRSLLCLLDERDRSTRPNRPVLFDLRCSDPITPISRRWKNQRNESMNDGLGKNVESIQTERDLVTIELMYHGLFMQADSSFFRRSSRASLSSPT